MKKLSPRIASLYRILFFSTMGISTLGQIERIQISYSVALYLHEVMMLLFLLLVGFIWSREMREGILHTRLGKVLLILQLWIVASIAMHAHSLSLSSSLLYLARFDLYLLFGFATYLGVLKKVLTKRSILFSFVLVAVGIAVMGIFQYLFIPDTRFLLYLGWDEHYLRLISTLFDPGFTGIVLALGALLLQGGFVEVPHFLFQALKPSKHVTLFLGGICFGVLFLALLLTYSRASFLAYCATSILFIMLRRYPIRQILILLTFILCIFLLPRPKSEGTRLERTASIVSRVESVHTSFSSFTPFSLLFGNGWYFEKQVAPSIVRGVAVPNHSSAPENSGVFVLSSLGIVGLGLFISIVYLMGKWSRWSMVFLTVCTAVFIHSLFLNTLFYVFVMLYLGILMASSGE